MYNFIFFGMIIKPFILFTIIPSSHHIPKKKLKKTEIKGMHWPISCGSWICFFLLSDTLLLLLLLTWLCFYYTKDFFVRTQILNIIEHSVLSQKRHLSFCVVSYIVSLFISWQDQTMCVCVCVRKPTKTLLKSIIFVFFVLKNRASKYTLGSTKFF